ncbi:hypothetical protein WJX73_007744 [Symbiochloris irregularis]|uniref:Mitochondrial import inner membrane translocase subunit TIM22 n=1 Tax=Symbiochloris irregularis TaxID=706552 RepID=A0AAW1PRC9_9CHLO
MDRNLESAEAVVPAASTSTESSPDPANKPKKQYQQLHMPTQEQMAQDDFMNNCATRTVLSGVLGAGLGVVFGIFMGTMDTTGSGVDMAAEQQSFRQGLNV